MDFIHGHADQTLLINIGFEFEITGNLNNPIQIGGSSPTDYHL